MEAKEFKAGEFVQIVGRDLEKDGILEGSYLYLAGDTFIPETPDDIYLYRKVFVAAKVIDYHIQADSKPFLVTAKNFGTIDEGELELLNAVYEADFKEESDE